MLNQLVKLLIIFQVSVFGEKEQLFTDEGAKKVKWTPITGPPPGHVTWYKVRWRKLIIQFHFKYFHVNVRVRCA